MTIMDATPLIVVLGARAGAQRDLSAFAARPRRRSDRVM